MWTICFGSSLSSRSILQNSFSNRIDDNLTFKRSSNISAFNIIARTALLVHKGSQQSDLQITHSSMHHIPRHDLKLRRNAVRTTYDTKISSLTHNPTRPSLTVFLFTRGLRRACPTYLYSVSPAMQRRSRKRRRMRHHKRMSTIRSVVLQMVSAFYMGERDGSK